MKVRLLVFSMLLMPALGWAAPQHTRAAHPTTKILRVCADPDNLPYSNRAGEGFENHLAQMIAHALDARVQYVWSSDRRHFLQRTLEAWRCEVVMGVPTDSIRVLTTQPYYRSSYALVYRKNAGYTLRSLDDPRLRRLRIGVRSVGDDFNDLPAGTVLAHRGIVSNVVTYNVFSKQGRFSDQVHMNSPAQLIDAVAAGDVDVAIEWGPQAGYFAQHQPVDLVVDPIRDQDTIVPFQFSISLGVRRTDQKLQKMLNAVLQRKRADINALLARYHVPLLALPVASEQSTVAEK